jgi:hypothetical protein
MVLPSLLSEKMTSILNRVASLILLPLIFLILRASLRLFTDGQARNVFGITFVISPKEPAVSAYPSVAHGLLK